ncbi:MAG: RdgB/HAM1 family non-canonical purine NTP pyrophosphatase [Capsulimonadaceae bacterium]
MRAVSNGDNELARVVVATTNAGKAHEIAEILRSCARGAGIKVITLTEAGLSVFACDEKWETYEANAAAKALSAARLTGLPSLADDSGLCVDALGGEPGVRSARWAGDDVDDAGRNAALLARLVGVPPENRTARFVCAAAFAGPDGVVDVAVGECAGLISLEPRGENGFGYDSIFLVAPLGRTLAELMQAEKNALSHRRAAFEALAPIVVRRLTDLAMDRRV